MDGNRIKEAILKDGFIVIEAGEVGQRVDVFRGKKYPFLKEGGLYFLKDTLEDTKVVETVESLFKRSGLGMFTLFGPHPDTARAPLNRTSDELLVVNVLHCGPGSKIILYENSHKHFLDARPPAMKEDDTGFLEKLRTSMRKPGITELEKTLPAGGFIFLDGRFFTTILQGVVLEVAFADEKELNEWNPIQLPGSPDLESIVDSMERERIKINIKFVK
ncbi:hypothetical protein VFPPC_15000 [Pochonia chlamydosporia 170]|uniref:Uncharacterized protein n=1 Tax=Pochonia chlamydosporia 170 TaxID=1380566 RepID=A0A179F3R9_METCM|nr:hypothetical protein VFPPC_15000 [Pochonia chlamydosporia 170]OAQ59759.1 hypothetical protein VFPPC_15000 [Pochonia chlamydosporia 170]